MSHLSLLAVGHSPWTAAVRKLQSAWEGVRMQPVGVINRESIAALCALLLTLGVLRGSSAPHSSLRGDASEILNARSRTPQQTIVLAKRLLGIPTTSPPGVLWRTYRTRLHYLPITASVKEMDDAEENRVFRYDLISERLPDWFPHWTVNAKENLEQNVIAVMIVRQVFAVPRSVPNAEVSRVPWERYVEYRKTTSRPLNHDDWCARQIITSFGLPPSTTTQEAFQAFERKCRIFGIVPLNAEEMAQLRARQELEEAQAVFGTNTDLTNSELIRAKEIVHQGAELESPDEMHVGFHRFY